MIKTKEVVPEFGTIVLPVWSKTPLEKYLKTECRYSNKKESLIYDSENHFSYEDVMYATGKYPILSATIKFILTTDGDISAKELYSLDKEAIDMMNDYIKKSGNKNIQKIDYPTLEERMWCYNLLIADHIKAQIPMV